MTQTRTRRRRRAQFGLWVLAVFAAVALAAGVLMLVLTGRYLMLPHFVTARVEARINAAMPTGSAVHIGALGVGISADTMSPAVVLRDVTLVDGKGDVQARLPRLTGRLDLSSLAHGRIRPVTVIATAARVHLRRTRSGQLDIRLGDALTEKMGGRGIESLPAFMEQLDTLFSTPVLAPLKMVRANDLEILYEDARSGRTFRVHRGQVTLAQTAKETRLSLRFSVNDATSGEVSNVAMTLTTGKGSLQTEFHANISNAAAADIAGQSAALGWLSVLDARLSASLSATIDKHGQLGRLSGTLDIGKGAIRPGPGVRPVPFNRARTYFSYDARRARIDFDEIRVDAPALRAVANGHAYVNTTTGAGPQTYLAQIKVSEIRLDPRGVFQAPVVLPGGAIDLRLHLAPFKVDIGQLVVLLGGKNKLVAKGSVTAGAKGWGASLDLTASRLEREQIMALWPLKIIPNTRIWVARNFRAGTIRNLAASLRARPGQPPRAAATFTIDGAAVKFMKFMPLLTDASGYGSFDGKSFTVVIDSGHVKAAAGGLVDMSGTTFVVPDVFKIPAPARISLKASGRVRAGLELLDVKPLLVMTKARQPTDLASGLFTAQAKIALPLMPKVPLDRITYSTTARLTSVRSDKLIKGRVLSAALMRVEADNSHVLISGQAKLDGIPVAGEWRQALGPGADHTSRFTGKMDISQHTADVFGIVLPKNTLQGSASGNLRLDLARDKPPVLGLTSNLRGLAVALPALGWRKPAAAAGKLAIRARLGNPASIDHLLLAGAGLSARGKVVLNKGGTLRSARFSSVRIGSWFDGPVELLGRGRGLPAEVVVKGGTLDLRKANFRGIRAGSAGPPISLSLDRLIVSDGITLTGVNGKFTTSRGLDGSFTARVNGKAGIRGRVVPQGARSALHFSASDGGAVLASAGLFASGHGGAFDMTLTPAKAAGAFNGKLKIGTMRVKGAYVLAQLLSAISVVGLVEQLAGDGIIFGNVEGDFRLTPAGVTITKAAAVGVSLGLSMRGIVDLKDKRVDLQGTVTPVYMFNGLFGALTGNTRREGLFGFHYRMTGPLDAPKVSVNPLSILAPGVFRRLFRRPIPKLGQ